MGIRNTPTPTHAHTQQQQTTHLTLSTWALYCERMHVKCSSGTHLNTINFTVISVRGDSCFRAILNCVFTSRSYSGRSVILRFKWIWIPVFHTHFLWSEINRITRALSSKHHSLWILAIATQTSICGTSESLLESSESSEDFKNKKR